jgi:hypothetical protein
VNRLVVSLFSLFVSFLPIFYSLYHFKRISTFYFGFLTLSLSSFLVKTLFYSGLHGEVYIIMMCAKPESI